MSEGIKVNFGVRVRGLPADYSVIMVSRVYFNGQWINVEKRH